MDKQIYQLSSKDVEKKLETNFERGLSLNQVKIRQDAEGENKLDAAKKR